MERMENWLIQLRFEIAPLIFEAYEDEEFVGWLMLFLHDEHRAEINPWALNGHPFIAVEKNEQQITTHLIQEAASYAQKVGITRIELSFLRISEVDQQVYDNYRNLYESVGFQFMTENVLMRRKLSGYQTDKMMISPEIQTRAFSEINEDDLYQSYYQIFNTGQDRFFFDQTEKERRAFFDELFDRQAPYNKASSLVLIHNQQIIGFSLVRPTHGEGNVHLWILGIHPDYRRKGLATALIHRIMQTSAEAGYQTMSLVCERSNLSAFYLYRSQGFQEEFTKIEYSWKTT